MSNRHVLKSFLSWISIGDLWLKQAFIFFSSSSPQEGIGSIRAVRSGRILVIRGSLILVE